ncbi:MAG: hypothetical protein ACYCQJ_15695 [Nitrososphaerales archaeon]
MISPETNFPEMDYEGKELSLLVWHYVSYSKKSVYKEYLATPMTKIYFKQIASHVVKVSDVVKFVTTRLS